MFRGSKYSTVLTVILIIAIIGIIAMLIFIVYRIYRKKYIENGATQAVVKFEESILNNNSNNSIVQNQTSSNGISGVTETNQQSQTSTNTGSSNNRTKYKGFYVVGTIKIPSIKLNYPILEKVTKKSLETSVAFLYGPGLNKVGNNVIIGHNYRNGTMFSNLKKLQNGAIIYITDESGNQVKYKMYKSYRTSGDDATYMTRNTNGKREISLSTCTDDSKARLIVWAREE